MIHINLLPEEYRRKQRTPIKLMLAVSGVVAVNASLAAWWGWTAFGIAAEVQSEYSVLQTEMDGLSPQVAYHKALESESQVYKHRENTLAGITAKRISWTEKVDELIDVVNRGGDGQRHLIWLDDLNVTQEGDKRSNGGGSLKAGGHSGSDKFAQVANFLEDVENSPFIKDFNPPAPPEGSESIVDEELMPAVVWAFPLELDLKNAEERQ
jgi:Tfp pilus assembly protein PilN